MPAGRLGPYGWAVNDATATALAGLRRARGQKDATVRTLYLLTPVLLVGFVVPAAFTHPRPGLDGRHLVVSIGVAAFVVGVLGRNATAGRAYSAGHAAFVAVLLGGSVALMAVQPDGPGAAGVLLAALCIARLLPVRAAVPLLVVAFVVLALVGGLDGNWEYVAVLSGLGALYGLLFLAFRLTEANRHAERLLGELRASQAAQARASGLAERQRIAREMHDVLAHSLSGLMLQLEGARMLAADDPSDPRLPPAINRAHQLGRTGLEEARRAIGMLRDDELPGPERLAALAAQFERDRGVPCRLTCSGAAHELGSEARLALYRVAQEALTNVAKHARPERVEVRLAYEPAVTRLTIEDFAAAADRREVASVDGYGLTGMRERAELIGGTLITEATDHGFRVELDVPAGQR
jgi:signal transduction histidine kinase